MKTSKNILKKLFWETGVCFCEYNFFRTGLMLEWFAFSSWSDFKMSGLFKFLLATMEQCRFYRELHQILCYFRRASDWSCPMTGDWETPEPLKSFSHTEACRISFSALRPGHWRHSALGCWLETGSVPFPFCLVSLPHTQGLHQCIMNHKAISLENPSE